MSRHLDREMDKVRRKQDAAMSAKASEGATQEGVMEAGIRAALEHSLSTLDPDLKELESALDDQLDGGSFLMGMMGAAFAMQDLNLIEVARLPLSRRLFVEYIKKARER